MTTSTEPHIILYDLACTKDVCFSPVVWKIRLMLNYKGIPYKTVFLEFPDIEPTLKSLGIAPHDPPSKHAYTVPAIHHQPSNTYLMNSLPIAQYLEEKYPSLPIPLSSDLGQQIEAALRDAGGRAMFTSIAPREVNIVCPRSAEYFRKTREATLGHSLEALLEGDKEEKAWEAADTPLREVDKLIMTNRDQGPFVLGAEVIYTDLFIAGTLQCVRTVDGGVFERFRKYEGLMGVYEGCLKWMEKKD